MYSTITLLNCLTVAFSLLLVGLWGISIVQKNLLISVVSLELILLSVSLSFISFGIALDDMIGELMSFFILVIAGSETAIILAILIAYHRKTNNIGMLNIPIKG